MKKWFQRFLYKFCVACKPHSSRTVRFAFPVLVAAVLFLSAAVINTNHSYVTLETSTATVKEGEVFSLDVSVYAHRPVNAIDLAISYPKNQVMVKGIDAGQSVITLWAIDPYIENNTVYLQGGTFGEGFVGEHFIARIDAIALKSGSASIIAKNITLIAGDGEGTEVETADDQLAVNVRIANEQGELAGSINVVKILTDIDGDGEVDMADILAFMDAWFTGAIIFDFSGDGKMTFRDFSILLSDSFTK